MIDLSQIEIGQKLNDFHMRTFYKHIAGALAWPGPELPGYAVVMAYGRSNVHDPYRAYVLDEVESYDTFDLLANVFRMDLKWKPSGWRGDTSIDANMTIMYQALDRFTAQFNHKYFDGVSLSPTIVQDMKQPYLYIMPELKRVLRKKQKRLILKDSKVNAYLYGQEVRDFPSLKLGAYPALEAICYATMDALSMGDSTGVEDDIVVNPMIM